MPPMLSKLARAHSSHFVIGVPNGTPLSQTSAALKDGHHETLQALLHAGQELSAENFAQFATAAVKIHAITTGAVTDHMQAAPAKLKPATETAKQLMELKLDKLVNYLYENDSLVKTLVDQEREDEDIDFDPHGTRLERKHMLVHVSAINTKDRLRAMSLVGKQNQQDRALWVSSFRSALSHTCWRKGGHIFYVYLIHSSCEVYDDFVAYQSTGDMRLCAQLKTDVAEDKCIPLLQTMTGQDGVPCSATRRCIRKYRLDVNERTFARCKAGE
jgi:hypothetical protein